MKLPDTEARRPELPKVELTERRVLLQDGRYLIFFSGSVGLISSDERSVLEAEVPSVRA
jgi:hypothetical protein